MLSWITNWTPENGHYAIQKTAECGFDLIEISLPAALDLQVGEIKKQLEQYQLECRCSIILPKAYHLPKYPDAAVAYLKRAIDIVKEMECGFLGGVFHSSIGVFTGHSCSNEEHLVIRDAFKRLDDYAGDKGIVLGIEPINRYESYVMTAAADVLHLINEIKAENLMLMLDTFHMNIEEQDFYTPVVKAGDKLAYVHLSESHRGMLGEGNVKWDDFFEALKEINYSGDLVLENFTNKIPGMAELTSLWRTSPHHAESLAAGSLRFMQQKSAQWGLNTR